ncbi:GntR family transcriptional regulator [Marimonas lutisalis]|uniref:GntR family transcriptional regulator n=1 Tax=Marimonas lutisalis TaxID=2545756 RepID=UPI0018755EFA|nr:GntR family transcriptional regulator [Marimonas lutisalis]
MPDTRRSWKEVRDRIHQKILSGQVRPGDKLPRDADIAAEMNCARTTVQRAMQDLADSGLVERRRKGGTHVRRDPVTRATLDIPITRNEVEQKGNTYGYQLIGRETLAPPHSVQAAFGQNLPGPMLHVQALHLADARPYILEDRWICLQTAPEILDVDLSETSANEWLVMNKPYDDLTLRFYAEKADEKRATLLGTDPGDALLVIERTTWISGAPITTVKSSTEPGYQLISRS